MSSLVKKEQLSQRDSEANLAMSQCGCREGGVPVCGAGHPDKSGRFPGTKILDDGAQLTCMVKFEAKHCGVHKYYCYM